MHMGEPRFVSITRTISSTALLEQNVNGECFYRASQGKNIFTACHINMLHWTQRANVSYPLQGKVLSWVYKLDAWPSGIWLSGLALSHSLLPTLY